MTHPRTIAALAAALLLAAPVAAQEPLTDVTAVVNRKLVKLYGTGGFAGLNNFATGVLVSPKGHILTVASSLLTEDLVAHLPDGRRYPAKLVVSEPALDVALLKLVAPPNRPEPDDLEYFDVTKAAARPPAQPGDWVLAFSNQFKIATRDEPVSVQHGVIAAYTKLQGRRGTFDASFPGAVYVLDMVSNNPGAGGGALTTRTGELLGLIGRELRNKLTETFVNYALPVQSQAEVKRKDRTETVTLARFVELAVQEKYVASEPRDPKEVGPEPYTGLVLVPNVVERTPPYVEFVAPDSPAAKAGLRTDDLIVYADGEPMGSIQALRNKFRQLGPGTTVKLEVRRGNQLIAVELRLEEPPGKK